MSFRYQGQKPMPVVFFFSGGASSMKAALESPDHDNLYRVVGTVTNIPEERASTGYDVARRHRIPIHFENPQHYRDREGFHSSVGYAVGEMGGVVIGLSGFLGKYSLISDPLLAAYGNRIINVHPADLSVLAELNGQHPLDIGRKNLKKSHAKDVPHENALRYIRERGWGRPYTGDDAVYMAALLGEEKVCSTIHSVTAECDGGPIIVQSERLPVDTKFVERMLARNAFDRIASYAHELQGEMKTRCDGPAFCEALRRLAAGEMEIFDDHVALGGEALPYGGLQMV